MMAALHALLAFASRPLYFALDVASPRVIGRARSPCSLCGSPRRSARLVTLARITRLPALALPGPPASAQ
jgi:ribosomal protein S14